MSQPPDKPTARVFFALWPTEAESGALAAWQMPLKQLCGGRAVLGKTLHLTLAFLGGIEQIRLESLIRAAQEVRTEDFELCFDGAHFWGRNHIVYAAPDHVPPQLVRLTGALEQSLDTHGFKFDQHEFKPHITLLRNARGTNAELNVMQPVHWQVMDFALAESVPQGGVMGYRVLARFPLKTGGFG